jgi:hypothetical protein
MDTPDAACRIGVKRLGGLGHKSQKPAPYKRAIVDNAKQIVRIRLR